MKIGELVLTNSIEVRSQVEKPGMRATFKSHKGSSMLFLALGSVDHESKKVDQAKRILQALGWEPPSMTAGEDEGIAAAWRKT